MLNRVERKPEDMKYPTYIMTSDPEGNTTKKIIDYGDHSDRVWLSKHVCWCLHHGHGVATYPHELWEPQS